MRTTDLERMRRVTGEVEDHFEEDQVPWLAGLVERPSHSCEPGDVEVAARFVDALASELGLDRRLHPDPAGHHAAHRVYSTSAACGGARALALVGHVDTVFPRAMGFTGFERDGDIIRGPGVLDMKSGLSVIFFALAAVRRAAPERWRELPVRVACTTDEEVGSPTCRAMLDELARSSSGVLVFEPGRAEDRLVMTRKGTGSYRVRATGRAAHAGNEHAEGVNAIHALALAVPRLEALTDYGCGTTVNVGLIAGGSSRNTVPQEACVEVDVRFERARDAVLLDAAIRRAVAVELPGRLARAEIEVEVGVSRPPMTKSAASQALQEAYERHAAAVGLGVGEAPLQGGGSDANILGEAAVPCIDGLGPWGGHAHSAEEWSSLTSLLKRTQALARYLLDP